MSYNPKMTSTIVESEDYFAANNIDGGVRFGLRGAAIFILKPSHAMTSRVKAAVTESDVESLFDELHECGWFKYRG